MNRFPFKETFRMVEIGVRLHLLSCSVTLEKREPFMGLGPVLVGQVPVNN